VFNLLPGGGLGFAGSKEIAFGLGAVTAIEVPITPPPIFSGGGGGWGGSYYRETALVYDNAYSRDDEEILELLSILFQVIE
jgi:hypothetical protein